MTYEEAQQLIQVIKKLMKSGIYMLPKQGERDTLELRSIFSENDIFRVDINRAGRINKKKYTLQLRYGKDQGLIRIDMGGPPHDNPDGSRVQCPHIHLQQTDTGAWDAWAFDLPAVFGNLEDRLKTLIDFLNYCNVNNISNIEICEQEEME